MPKKPNRLGRGLNSLVSSSLLTEKESPEVDSTDDRKPQNPPQSPAPQADGDASTSPHRIDITEDASSSAPGSILSRINRLQASEENLDAKHSDLDPATPRPIGLLEVSVHQIRPNSHQPRKAFDAVSIGRLARSIAESGILQPLLVRPADSVGSGLQEDTGYELIAGERRLRAAKAAGIATVPVIIKRIESRESMELALIENVQREDLNPIDRARAYQSLCEHANLTAQEASHRLGEDRSTIANYLRLLELPDSVRKMVETGQLSMGHARALLGSPNPEVQHNLAQQVATQGLSVRAVESLVKKARSDGGTPAIKTQMPVSRDANLADIEEKLQQAAKTKVTIKPGRGGKRGKIVLEYYSLDDFDRLAALLGYSEESAR